jgi:hypothetical protein
MKPEEVIKELNKRGFLAGRPQPDGSMEYEWTVLGDERNDLAADVRHRDAIIEEVCAARDEAVAAVLALHRGLVGAAPGKCSWCGSHFPGMRHMDGYLCAPINPFLDRIDGGES